MGYRIGSRLFVGLLLTLTCIAGVAAGYAVTVTFAGGGACYRPDIRPSSRPFCGLSAVATICTIAGRPANLSEVYLHAGATDKGTTLAQCQQALTSLDVPNKFVRFRSLSELPERVPILCPLHVGIGRPSHAVVIYRIMDRTLMIDGRHIAVVDVGELSKVTLGLAIVPIMPQMPADRIASPSTGEVSVYVTGDGSWLEDTHCASLTKGKSHVEATTGESRVWVTKGEPHVEETLDNVLQTFSDSTQTSRSKVNQFRWTISRRLPGGIDRARVIGRLVVDGCGGSGHSTSYRCGTCPGDGAIAKKPRFIEGRCKTCGCAGGSA
jgi:hypothetical protein